MSLDLEFVRAQYPAGRWQCAFFENAGGAFVPNSVIERMTNYLREAQVQPGYASRVSTDAAERMALGQRLMAEMIGADQEEVILAASTSINVYVLAQALRHQWQAGDEILVSVLNHEANSGPWRRLAEFGLRIVDWPVTQDAALDMDALPRLLSERTRLVAFPHVSNITGEINDVAAITRAAHEAGAMVCVDGVAYAPHRALQLKTWDVDFYLFSYYKVFGPHLACLYGKRERLLEARGQYHYFFPEHDLGHKLNPAGPNHEAIASLAGIVDYLEALHRHHGLAAQDNLKQRIDDVYRLIASHEETLASQFLAFANERPGLRLIGPAAADRDRRVPTFSFLLDGLASATVPARLAEDDIAIGAGHFYARRLLDALDVAADGVVRCSMAHYNTRAEVSRLIASLERLD